MNLISKKIKIEENPYFSIDSYKFRLNSMNATHFCYVKRDGNCFYNAFTEAFLSKLSNFDSSCLDKLNYNIKNIEEELKNGFGSIVAFECFSDVFKDEIKKTKNFNISKDVYNIENIDKKVNLSSSFNLEKYEDLLIDNLPENQFEYYNDFTGFYKMMISTHMKIKKDFYETFIGDVNDYCKKRVDGFFVDASDVEISALAEILCIGIKILHFDTADYEQHYGDTKNFVTLLYTPSHFEPLFRFE